MGTWIVEPHDPLIFRDARPFGPTPGARSKSLPFPFPSTIAGGARAQAADENGSFRFRREDTKQIELLKALPVAGPLLVELDPATETITWLFPSPSDALLLKAAEDNQAVVKRLLPLELPSGVVTDFDFLAGRPQDCSLIGLREADPGKPLSSAPRYWYQDTFLHWLYDPSKLTNETSVSLDGIGQQGPVEERRVHIRMDSGMHTSYDGALFDTSGLEFARRNDRSKLLSTTRRLGLAVFVDDADEKFRREHIQMHEGFNMLGGERRMVYWSKGPAEPPACPQCIRDAIVESKQCRVFLLTPACFTERNYYPTSFLKADEKVELTVQAIALTQRPPVVSGWDMQNKQRKGTRRLTPTGTVMFLKLKSNNEADIHTWITKTWMSCISDTTQDCLDGFGLAVLGTWGKK